MKLEKTKLQIEIYGEQLELRAPNYLEASEYRMALNNLSEKSEATEIIKGFLIKLGLTEAVFNSLEMGHVQDILEYVLTPKKK
jgi:hypothetical protein